jgi:branched-chain amino acid transport system ATP-binding protein
MSTPLLQVEDLHTFYGDSHVLQGLGFSVERGSVVALLGRNGAGKTTTLRSIVRLTAPQRGRVTLDGLNLGDMATYEIARAGVAFVQETRAIFPSLTVEENLTIAARPAADGQGWTLDRIYERFPELHARRRNGGTQLSGGEQQMLAIARALIANPVLLLLDEPSEGLAPLIVRKIRSMLLALKVEGTTMLLVEQNFALATSVADYIYVLGKGRIRWAGTGAELHGAEQVKSTWLGV